MASEMTPDAIVARDYGDKLIAMAQVRRPEVDAYKALHGPESTGEWIRSRSLAEITTLLSVFPEIVCRKGCSGCCEKMSTISVTDAEARALARYVRELPDHAEITERARIAAEAGAVRQRCPLLGSDGSCHAYPVRPLVCASYTTITTEKFPATADACAADHQNVSPAARSFHPGPVAVMGVAHGLIMRATGFTGKLNLLTVLHPLLSKPETKWDTAIRKTAQRMEVARG